MSEGALEPTVRVALPKSSWAQSALNGAWGCFVFSPCVLGGEPQGQADVHLCVALIY